MSSFRLERILVPTDFSELATSALGYASEIAAKAGAEIEVLYADPFLPPHHFLSTHIEEVVQAITHSKQLVGEELDRYLERNLSSEIEGRAVVIEDMPVPAIVKHSSEADIDLIIMGTHGRGGLSRVMLGSVTERVIRESDKPVLAVRVEGNHEVGSHPIRKIICPVNFSDIAKQAAGYAVGFSRMMGAELVLFHVAEAGESRSFESLTSEIDGWCCPEGRPEGVMLRSQVGEGKADEQVVAYARKEKADLIILGAQHRLFSDTTVIGTTTIRVVRHASCPVLTVIARPA